MTKQYCNAAKTEERKMNTPIPWAFLKETPPGSKGLIPGVGLRYAHCPRAPGLRVEQIVVDVGNCDGARGMFRILREPSKKSGWGRPHLVMYDHRRFE